jgi:HK97 family phage prohead protease
MTTIHKIYSVVSKAVDIEKGIYEAWVSTEVVDRDGDILLADGAETENYSKNPIVLFGHNYHDPEAIVAKTLEVAKISGQGIKLTFQFLKRGISQAADLVQDLWKEQYLNAMSVGFIPKTWEKRKDENDEDLARGLVFSQWELLEGSIVSVPANQDALRAAYGEKYDAEILGKVFDDEYNGDGDEPDIEPEPIKPEQDKPEPSEEDLSTTDEPPHNESEDLTDEQLDELTDQFDEILEVLQ